MAAAQTAMTAAAMHEMRKVRMFVFPFAAWSEDYRPHSAEIKR
jgi:hypothetical protein